MLGVQRVGPRGAAYYLSDRATELPSPVAAHWAGRAADGLGLDADLDEDAFRELLAGRHPRGGDMRPGRATVGAYDLTFSSPKSVSVLFGLGGGDVARTVLVAHAEAVAGALRYVEDHALSAVRQADGVRRVIPVTGAVAGVFTHGASRSADPHVHTHVVVANVVQGLDGRWGAMDQRALYAHRPAAAAVYAARLRAALTERLGVRWSSDGARDYEVEGVSAQLRAIFSTRSADIRRYGHQIGARSRRGRQMAWAVTRPPKVHADHAATARQEWATRAREAGFGPLALRDVLGRPTPPRVLDEHRYAATIWLTPHGGAHRREVVAAFGNCAPHGIDDQAFAGLLDAWVPAQTAEAVGVAEPRHRRSAVLPAHHLVAALGPRPATRRAHDIWLGAAGAIDAYRSRWGLHAARDPVAIGPSDLPALASMSSERLADHLRTARRLAEARMRLGLRDPVSMELGLTR